jgi:hypothetical protein
MNTLNKYIFGNRFFTTDNKLWNYHINMSRLTSNDNKIINYNLYKF